MGDQPAVELWECLHLPAVASVGGGCCSPARSVWARDRAWQDGQKGFPGEEWAPLSSGAGTVPCAAAIVRESPASRRACRVEPGWTLVLAVPPPAGCAPLGPFASPSLTWLLAALSAMGSYVPWTRSGAPGVAAWLWQSPWDADPQWAPRLQGCRLSLLLAASERCFPLGAMCLAHSSPQTLPSGEPGLRAACVLTPLDPQRADSLPPAHPLSPPAVPPPDPVVCGRLQPPSGLSVLCLHWPGRRRWQVLIDCHISKAGRERFKILSHPKQTD